MKIGLAISLEGQRKGERTTSFSYNHYQDIIYLADSFILKE